MAAICLGLNVLTITRHGFHGKVTISNQFPRQWGWGGDGIINIKLPPYTVMGIFIIKIRRSHVRLIFITGIPIPGNTVFIWRQGAGRIPDCYYMHYNDFIMGAIKSPASRLFTQPFIQAQIKENIKAPRH